MGTASSSYVYQKLAWHGIYPSATSSNSTTVLAMIELDKVAVGVREHLDPPGTTLIRFVFELYDINMCHVNFW